MTVNIVFLHNFSKTQKETIDISCIRSIIFSCFSRELKFHIQSWRRLLIGFGVCSLLTHFCHCLLLIYSFAHKQIESRCVAGTRQMGDSYIFTRHFEFCHFLNMTVKMRFSIKRRLFFFSEHRVTNWSSFVLTPFFFFYKTRFVSDGSSKDDN